MRRSTTLVLLALVVAGCSIPEASDDVFAVVVDDDRNDDREDDDDGRQVGLEPGAEPERRTDREPISDPVIADLDPIDDPCATDRLDVFGETVAVWPILADGTRGALAQGEETPEALALHETFEDVVPPEQRPLVCAFVVFDADRDDDTAGYASVLDPASGRFEVAIEVDETGFQLDFTMIHELGHVLSVGPDDVDDIAFRRGTCEFLEAADTCILPGSELDRWIDAFWSAELLAEQERRVVEEDDLFGFFDDHQREFVNDYAATNPSEDFAETFGIYVLGEPVDSPVLEAKVAFFDTLPEFARVKEHYRSTR